MIDVTIQTCVRVAAVMPSQRADGSLAETIAFSSVNKAGEQAPIMDYQMVIEDPALMGKITVGDAFYVNFVPARG